MKIKAFLSFLAATCLFILTAGAQEEFVYQTFKDRRVINVHSVETLPKRKLDVRITHRFGDIAGEDGGWPTFYGLEQATDVMIGLEYGVNDNLTVGGFRSSGAGQLPNGVTGLRQLLNGVLKYRLLHQTADNRVPISLTAVGVGSYSTEERLEEASEVLRSFPKPEHRLAYHFQVMVARKFSDGFSFQLNAGLTHRNLVASGDLNDIFSIGAATRLQISKVFGIIADITIPVNDDRTFEGGQFYPALGIGLEIETGGHVFQVNFTNATAIMETDFIPYTTSNWLDGQFRLGFTISRLINI